MSNCSPCGCSCIPCCCQPFYGGPSTTTTTRDPNASTTTTTTVCENVILAECIVYNGTFLTEYGINPGDTLTDILNLISQFLCCCSTTTTTLNPNGCYCYEITNDALQDTSLVIAPVYDDCVPQGQIIGELLNPGESVRVCSTPQGIMQDADCVNVELIGDCSVCSTTSTTSSTTSTTSSTSTTSTTSTSSTTSSTTSTTSSTTSSSTTTTTTASLVECYCLTWTSTEVTVDTTITWTDCNGDPQSLLIPTGSTAVDVTRCGINPDSDNPGEVTATQNIDPCSSQPNGTFVCAAPPCTLYYLKVLPPYDVDPLFGTDYYYTDCNTGEILVGSIGLASPLGVNCLAVYASPGTVGPTTYLDISVTPCS